MQAIKNFFLQWHTRQATRQNQTQRKTLNYTDAQHIGILFETHNEQMHQYINQLVKKLEKEGKILQMLTYFDRQHNNPYNFEYEFFTQKDINLFGQIKSEEVQKFINTNFDYLYCISLEQIPAFDYILAKSKAKCRVGSYNAEKQALFEMMILIEHKQDIDQLIHQSLHYTKALTANR